MLKVRLMGTIRDIKWFEKMLLRNKSIVVSEFSAPYQIKGSKKNRRVYVEVERAAKKAK